MHPKPSQPRPRGHFDSLAARKYPKILVATIVIMCYSTNDGTQGATIERGMTMQDVEKLKAIYEEKQAKYHALCEAVAAVYEAHQSIKAMCDEAMTDMQKAGENLLEAMKA